MERDFTFISVVVGWATRKLLSASKDNLKNGKYKNQVLRLKDAIDLPRYVIRDDTCK